MRNGFLSFTTSCPMRCKISWIFTLLRVQKSVSKNIYHSVHVLGNWVTSDYVIYFSCSTSDFVTSRVILCRGQSVHPSVATLPWSTAGAKYFMYMIHILHWRLPMWARILMMIGRLWHFCGSCGIVRLAWSRVGPLNERFYVSLIPQPLLQLKWDLVI